MILEVWRYDSATEYTRGVLTMNEHGMRRFLCHTLEDEFREHKVAAETRIPAGTYRLTLRKAGGHHEKYARRFNSMHKGMLWVRDVPGFEWILIHCGNTEADTAGCLLVGREALTAGIGKSTAAYKAIYPRIAARLASGQDVFITYTNLDTPLVPGTRGEG